jgi:hypothetical protein
MPMLFVVPLAVVVTLLIFARVAKNRDNVVAELVRVVGWWNASTPG